MPGAGPAIPERADASARAAAMREVRGVGAGAGDGAGGAKFVGVAFGTDEVEEVSEGDGRARPVVRGVGGTRPVRRALGVGGGSFEVDAGAEGGGRTDVRRSEAEAEEGGRDARDARDDGLPGDARTSAAAEVVLDAMEDGRRTAGVEDDGRGPVAEETGRLGGRALAVDGGRVVERERGREAPADGTEGTLNSGSALEGPGDCRIGGQSLG